MVELSIEGWVQRGLLGLGVLAGFAAAALLLRLLARRFTARLESDDRLRVIELLLNAAWVLILLLGAISALGTFGVNVSAMVASLGLTGFALGFALRDALSNLLAGVLILLYRPFHTGQRVQISGFEGSVTSINLRYIVIDADEREVLVPSSTVLTNPVVILRPPAPDAPPADP